MQWENESKNAVSKTESEFVCEAADAVRMRFVKNVDDFEDKNDEKSAWFIPEFTHQHFGDGETIVGYSDLDVGLSFTAGSLHCYFDMKYDKKITEVDKTVEADNVLAKISDLWPEDQKIEANHNEFLKRLKEDVDFRPFGDLMHSYSVTDKDNQSTKRQFCIYMQRSPSDVTFQQYLGRMQSFAFWFIDAAQFTDAEDEKWTHFMMYEKMTESTGTIRYCFAGYASVYDYYAYPQHIRPRIAQILVLPPYRRAGHGVHLLQTIYNHFVPLQNVIDITAEEPAENFVQLRDYVDCVNCSQLLASFSSDKLKDGFTNEMANEAAQRLKIPKKQARRVYEILRLKHTNVSNDEEFTKYRLAVKQRLNIPYQKSQKQINRSLRGLTAPELVQVVAAEGAQQRRAQLHKEFEQIVGVYRHVINRLDTYGKHSEHPVAKMAPVTETSSSAQKAMVNGYADSKLVNGVH